MTYIGIDGGGSKTAFAVRTGDRLITHSYPSPTNPNDVGIENSVKVITDGISKICASNGIPLSDIKGVFCGIAGATGGDYKAYCRQKLAELLPDAKTAVSHDGENIIYAAFPDSDGAIVICGTGSSCFVKTGGVLHRIGGYSTFDMLGSGYEIGKAAIAHTLRCIDGRDKPGKLSALVTEKSGGDPLGNIKDLLALGKTGIASYAPCVFDAYKDGDVYAEGILESNMRFIAEYIDTASRFFSDRFGVCMAGGIGTSQAALEMIRRFISSKADVFPLTAEPVSGALYKAENL